MELNHTDGLSNTIYEGVLGKIKEHVVVGALYLIFLSKPAPWRNSMLVSNIFFVFMLFVFLCVLLLLFLFQIICNEEMT